MLHFIRGLSLLYLDMRAGGEPGLVGQHFVNVVKEPKAKGCHLQTLQPLGIPAHPQKMRWVQVHQVVAVMTCCSLLVTGTKMKTQKKKKSFVYVWLHDDSWWGVWMYPREKSQVTNHDGDVMAVWQRQGAIHVQDVMLCAQEALQVLRVRRHLLGHGIYTPPADQQWHSLLLTIHHHLQKQWQGRERLLVSGRGTLKPYCTIRYSSPILWEIAIMAETKCWQKKKKMRTLMAVKNLKIMLDEAALNYTTVNPKSLALWWSLDVTKERLWHFTDKAIS